MTAAWRTPPIEARIRALWAEGDSAGVIASKLGGGITKNQIIRSSRTLRLARRDSPLPSVPAAPKPERLRQAPLPVLTSTLNPEPSPDVAWTAPPPRRRRAEPCSWVSGHRGNWLYCADDAVPGKSYCVEHDRATHVRTTTTQRPVLEPAGAED